MGKAETTDGYRVYTQSTVADDRCTKQNKSKYGNKNGDDEGNYNKCKKPKALKDTLTRADWQQATKLQFGLSAGIESAINPPPAAGGK